MELTDFKRVVVFTVLSSAALAPTALVTIPAMEDYLDHLGRMYILAAAGSENANPFYKVSWALYPYLAMDVIVPLLGRATGVEAATKIFFLTSQLLVIAGAIAVEVSVKGRHVYSGFAALLTLHSMPFSLGFVNFEFGIGVALCGIASWIALSGANPWRRFLSNLVFVPIIFASHFFALGVYGLTIGLFELRKLLIPRFDVRRAILTATTLVTPVLFMLILMVLSGAAVGEVDNDWIIRWKPIWLAFFLNGYNADLASGSCAALAVALIYGAVKRDWSLSSEGKWITFGFILVFLVMPFKLFSSRMADIRMITAAFLILPAFMIHAPKPRSSRYFTAAVIASIILVNSSYVGYLWISYQHDYEAMKASFAFVRRNSLVLVGSTAAPETLLTDAPMWRAPTLAVHYANAFVSSLYTLPGTHAVEIRPEWQHLDVNGKTEAYQPPSLTTLKTFAEGGNVAGAPRYIRNWYRDFDFVYLLGPHVQNPLPAILEEVFSDRRFTLYRVRQTNSNAKPS
jgi:hypothetical protein